MELQELLESIRGEIEKTLFIKSIDIHLSLKENPAIAELRLGREKIAEIKRFKNYIEQRMLKQTYAAFEFNETRGDWYIRISSSKDKKYPKGYLIENILHKLLKEVQQYKLKHNGQRIAA